MNNNAPSTLILINIEGIFKFFFHSPLIKDYFYYVVNLVNLRIKTISFMSFTAGSVQCNFL